MSDFLILKNDEIDQVHWDRASEILDFFGARDDSDWDDLLAMIAEALQITENNCYGSVLAEEDIQGPEVEVTSTRLIQKQLSSIQRIYNIALANHGIVPK